MSECSCEVKNADLGTCNSCSFGEDGYMAFDCCNFDFGENMPRVGFTASRVAIDSDQCSSQEGLQESQSGSGGGSGAPVPRTVLGVVAIAFGLLGLAI